METELADYDDDGIGIIVTDENDLEHQIEVSWNGQIPYHGTDDYPHKREDRTQDEQRIMSQVEERAKYAAQQEFPEADILDPMWDPEHLERGVEALSALQLDVFHREFRDFYAALADPQTAAEDPRSEIDPASITVFKGFTLTEDTRVAEVDDVALSYRRTDDTVRNIGRFRDDDSDLIVCSLPPLEFEDGFDFEEQFHELVMTHLLAQIRDVYLHMGEEPPDEYKVQGIGKREIHGDGFGDS